MKRALITGITGQDGSYLTEILLARGYEVHGIKRRGSSLNTARIDHLIDNPNLKLHYGDLCDAASLNRIMRSVEPDEIYNLGAQSHVAVSFEMPEYTLETIANGTLQMLEAMRNHAPKAKFYQASSSEMFGNVPMHVPSLTIDTPLRPVSPYGVAKVAAHHFCQHYRQTYGLNIVCGILFNHESPRRGETFVTRKITRGLARIRFGLQKGLVLGYLGARRDWGFAGEYMRIVHNQMQAATLCDFTLGTGVCASVGDFLAYCEDLTNVSANVTSVNDKNYRRPSELHTLVCGDSVVQPELGWRDVAKLMVTADLHDAEAEAD